MAQEATVMVPGGWALSLTHTLLLAAGYCSAWIQLQSVWKSSLLVLLDSQGALVAFCFACCVSLLGKGSTLEICFSP